MVRNKANWPWNLKETHTHTQTHVHTRNDFNGWEFKYWTTSKSLDHFFSKKLLFVTFMSPSFRDRCKCRKLWHCMEVAEIKMYSVDRGAGDILTELISLLQKDLMMATDCLLRTGVGWFSILQCRTPRKWKSCFFISFGQNKTGKQQNCFQGNWSACGEK